MDTDQIFSKAEQADLDLARKVRHRVIKEYTEEDLPTAFDMDRLLTVTTQLEAGALSQAKIRIKQQEANGKDINNAILAKLVQDIQQSKGSDIIDGEYKTINEDDFILPDSLDVEPVEGGLRIGDSNPDLYDEIFGTPQSST